MRRLLSLILAGVLLTAVIFLSENRAYSGDDRGPVDLTLTMMKKGPVPFPHQRHQEALEHDCMICHDLFPEESGGIEQLKEEKVLKSKQVMNKHCIKCHKARKKEGLSTGPTSCKACHIEKQP